MEESLQAAAQADLLRIRDAVQRTTGRVSRWNERVLVLSYPDFRLRGQKAPECHINLLDEVLRDDVLRWTVMIHESLHAVSAGGNILEHYRRFRAWEEGVVELAQRALRPRILKLIGVRLPADRLVVADIASAHTTYVRIVEARRLALGLTPAAFALEALRVPLAQRPAHFARAAAQEYATDEQKGTRHDEASVDERDES